MSGARLLRALLGAATPGPVEHETRVGSVIVTRIDGVPREVMSPSGQAVQFDSQLRRTDDLLRANGALVTALWNAGPAIASLLEACEKADSVLERMTRSTAPITHERITALRASLAAVLDALDRDAVGHCRTATAVLPEVPR